MVVIDASIELYRERLMSAAGGASELSRDGFITSFHARSAPGNAPNSGSGPERRRAAVPGQAIDYFPRFCRIMLSCGYSWWKMMHGSRGLDRKSTRLNSSH